ncbi:hypothetical protein [Kitasatospora sp. NPDC057500]|uniref:hypothetical protein n=1 Tax=Kitasatospora sp. NPDC057500 TaxID=3346151 RepID=UPI00367ED6D2
MSVMDTALRESLKALRLSGMLETLDARLIQAHGGELTADTRLGPPLRSPSQG